MYEPPIFSELVISLQYTMLREIIPIGHVLQSNYGVSQINIFLKLTSYAGLVIDIQISMNLDNT